MKYELKDCQMWIDDHRTWIVSSENANVTPIASYSAEELLEKINNYIDGMEKEFAKRVFLYMSMHELLIEYWEDEPYGLHDIISYARKRGAFKIIQCMVEAKYDKTDIVDCLKIILQLDDTHEDINDKLLYAVIEEYNRNVSEKFKINN